MTLTNLRALVFGPERASNSVEHDHAVLIDRANRLLQEVEEALEAHSEHQVDLQGEIAALKAQITFREQAIRRNASRAGTLQAMKLALEAALSDQDE